jgi:hypothetical protein
VPDLVEERQPSEVTLAVSMPDDETKDRVSGPF